MEYLQYTADEELEEEVPKVLNLIINGIPSILKYIAFAVSTSLRFKPYYKWNTFNTCK